MNKFTLFTELKNIVNLLPDLIDAEPILSFKDLSKDLRLSLSRYIKYYNLPSYNNSEVLLTIGKVRAFDFDIAVQMYTKNDYSQSLAAGRKDYKGIVFFVHGYLDHFGLYTDYIQILINNNYIVVGLDLPGHGLSTGKLGDIVDFGQYANSIEVMVDTIKLKFSNSKIYNNLNYYISGFSAGGAISIEYLLRNSHEQLFKKILLFSPLLRAPTWRYEKLACYLSSFIKFVPREPKMISHDPSFVNFVKYNDPLQAKFLPLRWVKAMHEWAARLPKYKPLDSCGLVIIQGTADKTIDWQYSILYITKIFPDHEVHYINNGYHNLCNESKVYKDKTFDIIIKYLSL